MATKSNTSPSNQTPKPSTEQVTISAHEVNPQEQNVCVTDSDSGSDSSLHGSNSGFKVHTAPAISPAKRRGGSRKGNSFKKQKRTKKSANVGSETPFKRKWEFEDEIVVLKEMCEVKSVDGKLDEISVFDRLKGKLKGEYSMDQVKNKMRNMRTKYGMWVMDGVFEELDEHETVLFRLSEKVWGDVVLRKNKVRENDGSEDGGVGGRNGLRKMVASVGNGVCKTVVNENGVGGRNVASVDNGVCKAVVYENGVGAKNVASVGNKAVVNETGVDGKKSGGKDVKSVGNGVTENGVGGKKRARKNSKSVGKRVRESVVTENGVGGKKSGGKNVRCVGNGARDTVMTENVDDGTEHGVNIANENETEEIEEGNCVRKYKRLCKSTVKLMKKSLNLIGKVKGNELDDEWKMLWMEEVELNQKKAIVRMKQIELVYGHIKNS